MKQANAALDSKRAYESAQATKKGSSGNTFYDDCTKNCFNGGTCAVQPAISMYICTCTADYAYTSSCLLSLDEFTAESGLKTKVLSSKVAGVEFAVEIMELAAMAPYRSDLTGNKLETLRAILHDGSIISKANQQAIINDLAAGMRSTYKESGVFSADNVFDHAGNALYAKENLVAVAYVAESILSSSRTSLFETDPGLTADAYSLLNLVGKILVQNALPGEEARSITTNYVSVTGQRVSFKELREANVSVHCNKTGRFNSSLVGEEYCEGLRFKLFSTGEELLQGGAIGRSSLTQLNESEFSTGGAVDITSVMSFLNVGRRSSPILGITLFNLSSPYEHSLNKTNNFLELRLPILSQRHDQSSLPRDNLTCSYFNLDSNSWPIAGCSRADAGTEDNMTQSVVCLCNHLTLFVLDMTAAKQAISNSNAKLVFNVGDSMSGGTIKEFVTGFPFWLILILLVLNILSILLHQLDLANKQDDRFFTQKRCLLEVYFPDPADGCMDFFANGGNTKEEIIGLLKVGMGADVVSKEFSSKPLSVFETMPQHKPDTGAGAEAGSTTKLPCLGLDAAKSSEKSLDKVEEVKENPEEVQSREFMLPRSPSAVHNPASAVDGNSPATHSVATESQPRSPIFGSMPRSQKIPRGSMLSSLCSSASFKRGEMPKLEEVLSTDKRQTGPEPFDRAQTSRSQLRLGVPQYSPCAFFKTLWLSIKTMYPLVSLFTFFNPAFPRPLRMLQTTTRIIGYMGTSAIFYNTTDKLRSSNEAIYVALLSSAVMMLIATLLASFFFVDPASQRTDENMSHELEKKLGEQIEVQRVWKHYFTMQEYYGLIINSKKQLYSSLAPCSDCFLCTKRLIGVLLASALNVFFLIFFLVFCSSFNSELIRTWELSFIYSLLLDIVGSQLLKVVSTVCLVAVMQRIFRTASSHALCASVMSLLGLDYY